MGNPVGLVNNVGAGVYDLFYEPAEGLLVRRFYNCVQMSNSYCRVPYAHPSPTTMKCAPQLGPKEFGKGVAKGATSLVRNTTYGVAHAAERMTGAVTKGIARLALDDEFAKNRATARAEKVDDIEGGLRKGAKGLAAGVLGGVTGLVAEPWKGAAEGGIVGAAKGIGKGVVGAVIKPTAGVLDLAGGTLAGIAGLALIERGGIRSRSPRYFDHDRVLTPYSSREATGAELLRGMGTAETCVDICRCGVTSRKLYVNCFNSFIAVADVIIVCGARIE